MSCIARLQAVVFRQSAQIKEYLQRDMKRCEEEWSNVASSGQCLHATLGLQGAGDTEADISSCISPRPAHRGASCFLMCDVL